LTVTGCTLATSTIHVRHPAAVRQEEDMHSLDPVPAVRRIETDRSDCAAFDIVGHVGSADVENLFGLLEAAYALHDRVDVLIRIVDHDGVDWSEVSSETVSEGKRHASAHVRRCATVGEPNWIPNVTGFFSPQVDVELKHFPSDEIEAAWAWIGAQPT
jgi:hypothetical protein